LAGRPPPGHRLGTRRGPQHAEPAIQSEVDHHRDEADVDARDVAGDEVQPARDHQPDDGPPPSPPALEPAYEPHRDPSPHERALSVTGPGAVRRRAAPPRARRRRGGSRPRVPPTGWPPGRGSPPPPPPMDGAATASPRIPVGPRPAATTPTSSVGSTSVVSRM